MDKGHLVASGSVAELIGSSGVVYLEVDDVERPRGASSSAADGASASTSEPPGLAVEHRRWRHGRSSSPRSSTAGVGVETVTARRRLEDAFLGLVEEDRGR